MRVGRVGLGCWSGLGDGVTILTRRMKVVGTVEGGHLRLNDGSW